ncbi:ABC transporter ATP-binding protein [Pseudonocardiaceae bacterium YIM PH 21723]|nr:ABC transporter ATP-binding protein [Pseudonocardiaceae bacterium YIM PH 21723]
MTRLSISAPHALGSSAVGSPVDDAAISVSGLVKRYGSTTAVHGLDLIVEPGTVFALLGPNGAGKTTTVETCEGFIKPDEGTVRVLGLDPVADGPKLRPLIGVMPQGGGAYPGVRADEMLRLVASCAANPLDPRWLLDVLGLTGAARTPYKRLSGGQQQRLSLACAIIGRPKLVFLDEPTAGLDPQAQHLVWELVNALRADGVTVLLTTHRMEEAEQLADQIAIIDRGRLVTQGSPAELTAIDPEADSQQLRFRSNPKLDLELLAAALPEECKVEETVPGRYLVQGPITPQVLSAVTAWCAQHGVLAHELNVSRRTLEDVFLELTGRELRS